MRASFLVSELQPVRLVACATRKPCTKNGAGAARLEPSRLCRSGKQGRADIASISRCVPVKNSVLIFIDKRWLKISRMSSSQMISYLSYQNVNLPKCVRQLHPPALQPPDPTHILRSPLDSRYDRLDNVTIAKCINSTSATTICCALIFPLKPRLSLTFILSGR